MAKKELRNIGQDDTFQALITEIAKRVVDIDPEDNPGSSEDPRDSEDQIDLIELDKGALAYLERNNFSPEEIIRRLIHLLSKYGWSYCNIAFPGKNEPNERQEFLLLETFLLAKFEIRLSDLIKTEDASDDYPTD